MSTEALSADVRVSEQSSVVRDRELAELLKRATFLLGTLCLATGNYPDNVARLLDDADAALKRAKE